MFRKTGLEKIVPLELYIDFHRWTAVGLVLPFFHRRAAIFLNWLFAAAKLYFKSTECIARLRVCDDLVLEKPYLDEPQELLRTCRFCYVCPKLSRHILIQDPVPVHIIGNGHSIRCSPRILHDKMVSDEAHQTRIDWQPHIAGEMGRSRSRTRISCYSCVFTLRATTSVFHQAPQNACSMHRCQVYKILLQISLDILNRFTKANHQRRAMFTLTLSSN